MDLFLSIFFPFLIFSQIKYGRSKSKFCQRGTLGNFESKSYREWNDTFLTSIRLIKKGFSRLKYPPHVAHVDGKVYFASSPVLGISGSAYSWWKGKPAAWQLV